MKRGVRATTPNDSPLRRVLKLTGITAGITVSAITIQGLVSSWLADNFAVVDKTGLLGLAATFVMSFGLAVTAQQLTTAQAKRSSKQRYTGSTVALIGAAVLAFSHISTGSPAPAGVPVGAPVAAPQLTPAATTPPTGEPVPSTGLCPLPDPTDPALPRFDVTVVYWCKADVYREDGSLDPDNYQIKVRPKLENNSTAAVDVSLRSPSSLRLLVSGKQIDSRWSPPPRTRATGDKVVLLECDGASFWAIPPNQPRDATLVPGGQYSGFVTTWDGTTLEPGGTQYEPLRHHANGTPVQEGNLVFQVPLDEDYGSATIYGLAIVDLSAPEPSVLGIARYGDGTQWISEIHPTQF